MMNRKLQSLASIPPLRRTLLGWWRSGWSILKIRYRLLLSSCANWSRAYWITSVFFHPFDSAIFSISWIRVSGSLNEIILRSFLSTYLKLNSGLVGSAFIFDPITHLTTFRPICKITVICVLTCIDIMRYSINKRSSEVWEPITH